MTTPLRQRIAEAIAAALPAGADATPEAIADQLGPPPDPALGDLSFPCFRLKKSLGKPPPVIASELAIALAGKPPFEAAQPSGPYLNVRVQPGELAALVLPPLARGLPEPHARPDGERVMVEFSQPNTHKAFHVGHMRTLFLGDALVRLLRAEGHDVIAANYLGDVGAHIAKCLWWYLDVLDAKDRKAPAEGRGEWLGELYSAASARLDELEDAAKAGDDAAARELAAVRARTTEILKQLEARDPELTAVWMETRSWSLTEFDEIYRWSMVDFDRLFYESEVDEPSQLIVDEFLATGVFHESDGAIGIVNAEVKHMPFFMLRKRDGTTLYATKDLALARLKFEEHRIDRSIYVVDSRQTDHFRHVFLTLAKMGFAQAQRCEHVPYEMVELTSGPMATRRGNVILFRALRENMLAHLHERYLAKYRGEWPDDEIDRCAHLLALGAIRYGMLSRDVNQKIVFDMDAWLELEGNTGPYLQYTAARMGSILRKGAEAGITPERTLFDDPARAREVLAALAEPEPRELVLALDGLGRAVAQAAHGLRPSVLCAYLHELAKVANRFVNAKHCRVLQAEGDVRTARLLLVAATADALRWGLARLGILSPPRM
ncbi:MAG TPA: arginine--tRNA ligase [Nannocystaceae bacterium]|nr:arginine--tRNA ligase [Nannocystaceae bacterium]